MKTSKYKVTMKTSKYKVTHMPAEVSPHSAQKDIEAGKPSGSISVSFQFELSKRDYERMGMRTTHYVASKNGVKEKRTLCGRKKLKGKPCMWMTCKKCAAIAEKRGILTPFAAMVRLAEEAEAAKQQKASKP